MDFKIAVHAVHSVRLFLIPLSKTAFACAHREAFHGSVKNLPLNRPLVRKTGVQKRTQAVYAVPSRTPSAQFCSIKINAREIREDFCRRLNALHHPVIYRSVKPLHPTAAYSAVPYVFTQNDKADRVLL